MLNKRARAIIGSITAQDLMDYNNRPDSVKHRVELLIDKLDKAIMQSLSEKKFKESLILIIEFVKLWEEHFDNSETKKFFAGVRAVLRTHFHADLCRLDKRFIPVAVLFHFWDYKNDNCLANLKTYRFCLESLLGDDTKPLFDEISTKQLLQKYRDCLEKDKTPWVYWDTLGIE